MRIHILGTGTPTPSPERFGSAFVAQFGDRNIMVDCGPATTHKMVKAGLWPTQVTDLFFTHHHFDHNVDYPCFLLTRWDQSIGDEEMLRVYGPTLTRDITEGLIGPSGVFAPDWKARVGHPASQRVFVSRGGTLPRKPPEVTAQDIGPGSVIEGDGWTMESAFADHAQPYLDSLAYRLETDEGTVVFTGDTEPCDSVVDLARGADLMFAMCWDDEDYMESHGEGDGVSGARGAAEMASRAGVSRLVLVHSNPRLDEVEAKTRAIGHARELYSGDVMVATELSMVEMTGGGGPPAFPVSAQ
jgi:ribonuclease BN (tRNA processing enzyme)